MTITDRSYWLDVRDTAYTIQAELVTMSQNLSKITRRSGPAFGLQGRIDAVRLQVVEIEEIVENEIEHAFQRDKTKKEHRKQNKP